MSIQIATREFFPDIVRKIADERVGNPRAYAWIRMYDNTAAKFARDRTTDCHAMLRGLVGDLKAPVIQFDYTGRELAEMGYDIVGAAYLHNFRIMFV